MATLPHQEGDFRPSVVPSKMTSPLFPSAEVFWKFTSMKVAQSLLAPTRHRSLLRRLRTAAPLPDTPCDEAADDVSQTEEKQKSPLDLPSPHRKKEAESAGQTLRESNPQFPRDKVSGLNIGGDDPVLKTPAVPLCKSQTEGIAGSLGKEETTVECAGLKADEELCRGQESKPGEEEKEGRIEEEDHVKQLVAEVRLGNVIFTGVVTSRETGINVINDKGEARFLAPGPPGEQARETVLLQYKGDFRSSTLEGEGQFTWQDGSVYNGQVLRGKRHGFGILTSPDGEKEYRGMWKDGQRNGQGTLRYDREGICEYTGMWVNNLRQGWGRQRYRRGVYEGQWKAGVRHGVGRMEWTDLHIQYAGQWRDGVPDGWGVQSWTQENSAERCAESDEDVADGQLRLNRYEGWFKNGVREGFGIFWYASGSRYEGYWRSSKKHGRAQYVNEAGCVHEAVFENDRVVCVSERFTDLESGLHSKSPLSLSSVNVSKKPFFPLPSSFGTSCTSLSPTPKATPVQRNLFFSTMVASSSASMLVSLDDIFLLEMLRTPPPQRLLATGNSRNTMGKPSRNPVAAQESSGAPGDARRRRDGGDKRRTTCDTEFKVLNPLSPQEATDRALCGTYKWILRNLKTLRRTYALYRRIACFPGQDPLSMSFLQFWILAADARLLTADRPLSRILRALEVATQFAPTPSECLNFAKTKSPSVALDSSSRSEPLGDGPVTHTPSTDTSKNCFSLEPTNDAFRSLGTGGPHESVCSGDSRCPLENGRGFPPLAGCTVASGASGYDGNASAGTSGNLHLSSAISDTAFNTSQPAMSSLSSRDRSTLAQPPRGTPNHCDVVEQRPLLLSSFLRALVLLAQDQLLHEEAVNANAATLVTSPWCPAPRKSVDVALSSFTVSLLQFYETCSSNVGGGSRKESLSNPTMKRNSSMCSRSGRKRSSSLASRRSSLSRKMASPQTFKSPSLDAFKPFTDPEILQAFAPLRPFFARRFAFVPPDAGPSFKCELEKASKTKKQPPGESDFEEYVEASRHPVSSALTNDTVDTFPAATMSRGPRMTGSVYLQEFLLMLRRWGLLISSAETEAAKQILPAEPSAPTTEEEQPSPSTEHSTLQPADSEKTAGASGGPFQPSRAQRTSPLSEAPGVVGRCEKSRRRLSVTAGSPDAKTKGQNARLAPAGAESEPAAPPEETEGPADSRSPGTPGTEAKDKCAEEKRQTPIPLRSLLCDAFKGASLAVTPVEVLYFLFHFLPEFHDQENALATFQELREEKRKKRLERAATNLPSNEILSPSLSVAPPPSSGSSPPRGNPGFEECPVPSRAEAFPAPGALGPNANSVASDAKRNGRNTKLRSPINSRPAAGRRGPGPDTSSPSSPSQSSKRGEKDEGKLRSENSRRRSGPRVTITNVPQVIVEESAPDLSTGTPRVDLNDRLDRLDGSAKAYATTGMARDDTNDDGEEQGNKHTGPQPTLRDGDNTSIRGKEENNHGMSYCRGKETTLKHHGAGGTLCWPRPFATRAIEKSYRKLLRKILGKRSASWTELVYREVTVIEVMMVLLKIVEFKTPPCLAAQLSLPFRLSILVGAIAQHELTQETCVSTSTKTQRCWPVLSLRDHPQVALLTLVSSQDPSELPMHFPPVISAPPEQLSRTTVERDSEKAPLSPSSHVVRSPALGATAARGPQQSSHTSGPAPPEALLFSAPAQSPTSPDKPGVSASGAAEGKKDFSNAFFWESFDSVPSLPRICEGKECGSFTVLDAPLLWATSDEDDAQEGNDSDRENEPSDTE